MEQEITCKNCNGKNIKKDGIRKTKNRGKVQRYKCVNCKKNSLLTMASGK